MRIARVHIEHFRSIKKLDFQPGPYCVLIGENNSGKSNILRALNLILGESWPSERSFTEEDFHEQDTESDIVIQVYFDQVIEEWRGGKKADIAGLELRCKAYKRAVKGKPAGTLKTDYICIDAHGKPIQYPADGLEKGQRYGGQWLPLRVSNDIRERLPLIYVDVLRDYSRQTPGSRWSMLRRLFNEVNAEFNSSKTLVNVTKADGTKEKMTRKDAFEQHVRDAYQYLRTDAFEAIEKSLAANAIEHMGLDEGESKIELSFQAHDPTNAFKSLELYVEQMGIRSPAGEVGAGLQSAIVVAIFRTYEELKKEGAVFAIEEPEVFLHPQKARYFASVLRSLADKGNQVLLTTHSPIFVQIHEPESVAVVRRTVATGTVVHQADRVDIAEDDRKALRLLTEFDAQRNELFFARRVLLVEGNTEKIAMPLVFRALGVDINKENISVIECGGKTQIPMFVRVAKALGIPFMVLADEDIRPLAGLSPDKQEKRKQANAVEKKRNEQIVEVAGADNVFFLKPSFEGELGLPHNDGEKIDQALRQFADAADSDIPACLRTPIERLLEVAA